MQRIFFIIYNFIFYDFSMSALFALRILGTQALTGTSTNLYKKNLIPGLAILEGLSAYFVNYMYWDLCAHSLEICRYAADDDHDFACGIVYSYTFIHAMW